MNDKKVLEVIFVLEEAGIKTWVFGGWAEELLEVINPRKHKDIDLLFPANDFTSVDIFFSDNEHVVEIKEKHFPHKRAFIYKEVMVELFLVQNDVNGLYTNFWGTKKHYWPRNVLDVEEEGLRVASKEALLSYRTRFEHLRK